jgi:hypothetical protein
MKILRHTTFSACLIACAWTFSARAEKSNSAKQLIGMMDTVSTIAREAVPLAKQEFPLLDAEFKGDQYNSLIAWLRTPVEKSNGIGTNETHFSEAVEQGQKDFVSATVLGTIDNLRGVDGVLLGEALAGSTLQAQLLDIYVREETALTHLSMMYDTWLSNAPPKH